MIEDHAYLRYPQAKDNSGPCSFSKDMQPKEREDSRRARLWSGTVCNAVADQHIYQEPLPKEQEGMKGG